MPPEIGRSCVEIGPRIEAQKTAEIYAPLQPKEPYGGSASRATLRTARTSATCSMCSRRRIRGRENP